MGIEKLKFVIPFFAFYLLFFNATNAQENKWFFGAEVSGAYNLSQRTLVDGVFNDFVIPPSQLPNNASLPSLNGNIRHDYIIAELSRVLSISEESLIAAGITEVFEKNGLLDYPTTIDADSLRQHFIGLKFMLGYNINEHWSVVFNLHVEFFNWMQKVGKGWDGIGLPTTIEIRKYLSTENETFKPFLGLAGGINTFAFNNPHDEIGALRVGYIFRGTMGIDYKIAQNLFLTGTLSYRYTKRGYKDVVPKEIDDVPEEIEVEKLIMEGIIFNEFVEMNVGIRMNF